MPLPHDYTLAQDRAFLAALSALTTADIALLLLYLALERRPGRVALLAAFKLLRAP